jgi:hypothetical protein
MRRLCQPWTPEEDERIRSFAAKGAGALRASAALKRNQHAVVQRARMLGCKFQTISAAHPNRSQDGETARGLFEGESLKADWGISST